MAPAPADPRTGPTLYLESGGVDGRICPLVFERGAESEFRAVQLTSSHAFDSLGAAFEELADADGAPSEAAVIRVTPSGDRESEQNTIGSTTLLGFSVDPFDLTGITIAFSKLLNRWQSRTGQTRICLRGIETLLQYHDTDLVYRFLNTVISTLQGAGTQVHMHLDTGVVESRTRQMLTSLFAEVVEEGEEPPTSKTEGDSDRLDAPDANADATGAGDSADALELRSAAEDVHATEMTAAEIDAFLVSEGLGILALGGDSPYAIPMTYGFDPDDRALIFQLGDFDGSKKNALLEAEDAVAFAVVAYERPDRWRSVVVEGRLREITAEEAQERDVFEHFSSGRLASVDVFTRDLADVDLDWYVLETGTFTGRKSVGEI